MKQDANFAWIFKITNSVLGKLYLSAGYFGLCALNSLGIHIYFSLLLERSEKAGNSYYLGSLPHALRWPAILFL